MAFVTDVMKGWGGTPLVMIKHYDPLCEHSMVIYPGGYDHWLVRWFHWLDPHNGALCVIMLTFKDNNLGGYSH